ncbi:transposase [Micromonospora sp. NPDC047548]|uniref:transposase n=1 Tax=Micromonospora sp. NPDC047548 TaxID=3155624 RepID=UPI0033D67E0E
MDLGLAHFAVLSDGTQVAAPNFLPRAARELRRLQQDLSRKTKGSDNRKKAVVRVTRDHPGQRGGGQLAADVPRGGRHLAHPERIRPVPPAVDRRVPRRPTAVCRRPPPGSRPVPQMRPIPRHPPLVREGSRRFRHASAKR